ncbi:MAG: hypothetical protein P8188_15720 [Gemmatimonadota bacterium]
MSENENTDDWIARMARRHYNPPPPTPREEMWAQLEARLGDGREPEDRDVVPLRRHAPPAGSRWWMALAASAVLAAGVGIGRWSRPAPEAPADGAVVAVSSTPDSRRNAEPSMGRMAAARALSESEPLLAVVRADVARGAVDAEVGEWAREVLGETRFLLDSGLALDPQVRSLLEDLELILLQTSLVGNRRKSRIGSNR